MIDFDGSGCYHDKRKEVTVVKKMICVVLLLCLGMTFAAAEEARTLELAFGLFSVDAPGEEAVITGGNAISDLRCEIGGGMLLYANYAPVDSYAEARIRMDGCVSMMYALSGPGEYTETEIAEETLPGGMKVRWQLMQGNQTHTLWFEAFTEYMGYNVIISGTAAEETDAAMLTMMRSFRVDAEQEQDVLQIRQADLGNGAFRSAEHGLTIRLAEGWQPVAMPELLLPQTAFILEKDGGRCLIQLFYTLPVEASDTRSLLEWYLHMRGSSAQPEAVALTGLGTEAWVAEEESGIFLRHIAFVHEGYGYYGSFMWIPEEDAAARPVMDAAIQSIAPAK